MGEQAVALARAVGYDSAGTVEFVAGQDKSFYFLEMNTRLQVEHPVTELVTGIDLVEQMILVAAGEPLDMSQERIKLKGWAVETRIYAEDPLRDFVPSTGRLTTYLPPRTGRDGDRIVRVDSGVVEGGEISIYYDPMIAKLVTYAPEREGAIAAQAEALDAFVIEGIRHNIPFLASLMAQPRWREGRLSTRFITEGISGRLFPAGARRDHGETPRVDRHRDRCGAPSASRRHERPYPAASALRGTSRRVARQSPPRCRCRYRRELARHLRGCCVDEGREPLATGREGLDWNDRRRGGHGLRAVGPQRLCAGPRRVRERTFSS